jgi:N-carbamoylputrescine amidase
MEARRAFTVGLVQMAMSADPRENLARAEKHIAEAARAGADLVCLPELFRGRYFCQREDAANFDLAEPIPGPTTRALLKIAKTKRLVIIAPVFERRAAGIYHNSAAVLDASGELAGVYRKMHIPDDPAYYEKYYFTPGDLGFNAVETRAGRIATLICWDQWYPEGARLATLAGASILFYPTAIGWHPEEKARYGAAQRDAWRTVQRGHAIANGVYVAAVNRVGFEPRGKVKPDGSERALGGTKQGIEFWGSSFLCDPFGIVVEEASSEREEVLVGRIEPARIEEVRRNWPFLRDRRIDAYGGIASRYLGESPENEKVRKPKRGVSPSAAGR